MTPPAFLIDEPRPVWAKSALGNHEVDRDRKPVIKMIRILPDADNEKGAITMRIAVAGRGHVGGGLGDLWARAGHEISRLGREGGDVSAAEVVLLAVPGGSVADAVSKLSGLPGKMVIDATNRFGVEAPGDFTSNAEYVKSVTGGPTAKSFNLNFALLYGRLGAGRSKPSNIWCGDEDARRVVEQLIRDAGYEPVYAGGLENAAALEHAMEILGAVRAQSGPFVYRISQPEDL
ncbi:MAG: dinucleotide-binding protein [Actinobacteria bacterium]|nr:dinucleotide-binding protein [Actinomycetota bacterium]